MSGQGGPSSVDHYAALGVKPSATNAQIKAAYRELAKAVHPDVNTSPGATAAFARISVAYEILSDAAKRAAYDRSQQASAHAAAPAPAPDLRAHYTWTNIAAHDSHKAAQENRQAEIDELYDTFFARPDPEPASDVSMPVGQNKSRTPRSAKAKARPPKAG